MGVQIILSYAEFISFQYIPRNEISGLYGPNIFRFLSNLHTVFYNGCTSLLTFSPEFIGFDFFNDTHSYRKEVKPQCEFYLHFPDDY